MTDIHKYSNASEWAAAAARALSLDIVRALADAEAVLIAVAGGQTPAAIVPLLNLEAPLWRRVTFTPTDERKVAAEDPARNDVRLRQWLKGALEKGARLVPLEDVEVARAPDIVLLGYGADRHIASLFPAGEGMAAATGLEGKALRARVTPEPLPDDAPFPRLTFTMRALTAARRVMVAASGADKVAALDAALAETTPRTPLSVLLAQRRTAVSVYLLAE